MPIRHSIIHRIDKKPDGSPAVLHSATDEMLPSSAGEDLLAAVNATYNAKSGKAWGLFHEESGAYPFSGWLSDFLDGKQDFAEFSHQAVEHLQRLMEESNLTTGGHALIAHYQQGMTDYLLVAMLQHSDGLAVNESLQVVPVKHLDLAHLQLAARINISEWRNNPKSRQYISFIKGKGGRRINDYFRDFIGCQEGIDGPGETRTLLKAFSDFVESEDLAEEQAREKTGTLLDYAALQTKIGEPITLEELSSLIDEDRPKAFFDHIRNKDYGLSQEFPADKRTLAQFKRFTGRAEGLSISFEAHLLGNKIEFDQARNQLVIRQVPQQLADQIKRAEVPPVRVAGEPAPEGEDPLYADAVKHVRESDRASISSVQRKLMIGYNRAARLIESMEMAGVVTPMNSNGSREVVRNAQS